MRYWVYLGDKPEAGPFDSYEVANRERDHIMRGSIMAAYNPGIYKIRTDEFERGGHRDSQPAAAEPAVGPAMQDDRSESY